MTRRRKKRASVKGATPRPPVETSVSAASFPLSRFNACLGSSDQRNLRTIPLYETATITADGSGIAATVFAADPSFASAWSSYATIWDEYRVLAIEVMFVPTLWVGGSTQTYKTPVSCVVDRNDATALTGVAASTRFESWRLHLPNQVFKCRAAMSGIEDSGFISTASPSAKYWIKIYTAGNAASQGLYVTHITVIVQFRGIGLT